jgi:hypothetical protein
LMAEGLMSLAACQSCTASSPKAPAPRTWLTYDGRNNVRQIHVGPDASTIQARDEFW